MLSLCFLQVKLSPPLQVLGRCRKDVFNSVFVLANDIEVVLLVMNQAKKESLGLPVFSYCYLLHVFNKVVVMKYIVLVAVP